MAKNLDVWVVESNTVYREVPYTVVTDWLQQGRLLGEDRVRLAGQKQWHAVVSIAAFAPYLPGRPAAEADDRAEALEPVELGVSWNPPGESEDEDVDMIPLIDISLVLLIFFMMTASVTPGLLSPIDTPGAKYQLAAISSDMWWVGIDVRSRAGAVEKGPDDQPLPWYSLGRDTEDKHQKDGLKKVRGEMLAPTTNLRELIAFAAGKWVDERGEVKIRLRADRNLPIETIKGMTLELQGLEAQLNRVRGGQRHALPSLSSAR